jgi:DNA polymerase
MPDKLYQECRAVISGCRAIFEDLLDSGIEQISLGQHEKSASVSVTAELQPVQPLRAEAAVEDSLTEIQRQLANCRNCGLGTRRKQVVFGAGNPNARLVIIGEAPDAEEDASGEPFVGAAGQLLDRILFAMKLSRDQIYLCNLIKCRPPEGRDPSAGEFTACQNFLVRQLAVIAPEVILCLGRSATRALVQSDEPIAKLRGRWQTYCGIPLMPTFHPAALLQNPAGKHQVWEDVKKVMHLLQEGEG